MNEFEELLDRRISEVLEGEPHARANGKHGLVGGYEQLAREVSRVLVEESPRLPGSTQSRHLARIRSHAKQMRSRRGLMLRLSWPSVQRWAQVAVLALAALVLAAGGLNIASANSSPGSVLYPFRRLAEQGNMLLTPATGERARVWMNIASVRLDEAERMASAGERIDPSTLDSIDQSIFMALAEIAATRGSERVALLQAVVQLAKREQSVLDELARGAAPADRAEFEETYRMLDGVASMRDLPALNSSLGPPTAAKPSPTGAATGTPVKPAAVSPAATATPTAQPSPGEQQSRAGQPAVGSEEGGGGSMTDKSGGGQSSEVESEGGGGGED